MNTDNVTRIEIIDATGRAFVGYYSGAGVAIELQDDDRTLKVFAGEPVPGFAIPPDQEERDRIRVLLANQKEASQ